MIELNLLENLNNARSSIIQRLDIREVFELVESIEELRKICQGPEVMENQSWYQKSIWRRFSIYFTKALIYTNISANQVTLFSILIGFLACVLLSFGLYWYTLLGVFLLYLWALLDFVDGETARYRGTSSVSGKYFDIMSFNLIHPLIFVSIAYGVYNRFNDVRMLALGFSASLFLLLIELNVATENWLQCFKSKYEMRETKVDKESKKSNRMIKIKSVYNRTIGVLFKFGPALNIILIGAIFGYLHIVLFIYGVGFPILWVMGTYRRVKHGFT